MLSCGIRAELVFSRDSFHESLSVLPLFWLLLFSSVLLSVTFIAPFPPLCCGKNLLKSGRDQLLVLKLNLSWFAVIFNTYCHTICATWWCDDVIWRHHCQWPQRYRDDLGKCDCSFIRSRPLFVLTGHCRSNRAALIVCSSSKWDLKIFWFSVLFCIRLFTES